MCITTQQSLITNFNPTHDHMAIPTHQWDIPTRIQLHQRLLQRRQQLHNQLTRVLLTNKADVILFFPQSDRDRQRPRGRQSDTFLGRRRISRHNAAGYDHVTIAGVGCVGCGAAVGPITCGGGEASGATEGGEDDRGG